MITNSSGASVDDPAFSVLEAELNKDEDIHIKDEGNDIHSNRLKIEQSMNIIYIVDIPAPASESESDTEFDSKLTNSQTSMKTRKQRKGSKRMQQFESNSEVDEDSDEEFEIDQDNDEEEDDEAYKDDYEDYEKPSPGHRTQKRSHKGKREEEDERIRSVCNLTCTICSAQFQKFNDLARHYQVEHETKGFVNCCKRKFKSRSRLLEHTECHINPNAFQ